MKISVGEWGDDSERGVAPVLAVLLMVGIVLIMAVAVTQFTTDIGDQAQDAPPSVVWDYDWSGSTVTIIHDSGNTIISQDTLDVEVQVIDQDEPGYGTLSEEWGLPIDSGKTFEIEPGADSPNDDTIGTGGTYDPEEGDEVRIIWTSPRGKSFIIGQYTIGEEN